jgi:hypothetical protein
LINKIILVDPFGKRSSHPAENTLTPIEPSSLKRGLPQDETNTQTHTQALPEGWAEGTTKDGRVYYIDHISKVTTWTDPRSLSINSKYRVKDHQGNIKEMIFTGNNTRVTQPQSIPQTQYSTAATVKESNSKKDDFSFEDPRKRAEERILKKLNALK